MTSTSGRGDRLKFSGSTAEATARLSADGHLLVSHAGTEVKLIGLGMDAWRAGDLLF